jgi:hypothetical protein
MAGGLVPSHRSGGTYTGIVHISDLYPTLVAGVAGISLDTKALDGVDLWSSMTSVSRGRVTPSSRATVLLQPLNKFWNGSCAPLEMANPFQPACGAAYIEWPLKLLVGYPGDDRTHDMYGPLLLSKEKLPLYRASTDVDGDRSVCVSSPCLFDVEADPTESRDISREQPMAVRRLHQALVAASQDGPPLIDTGGDSSQLSAPSCEVVLRSGSWLPWDDADQCTESASPFPRSVPNPRISQQDHAQALAIPKVIEGLLVLAAVCLASVAGWAVAGKARGMCKRIEHRTHWFTSVEPEAELALRTDSASFRTPADPGRRTANVM